MSSSSNFSIVSIYSMDPESQVYQPKSILSKSLAAPRGAGPGLPSSLEPGRGAQGFVETGPTLGAAPVGYEPRTFIHGFHPDTPTPAPALLPRFGTPTLLLPACSAAQTAMEDATPAGIDNELRELQFG